MTYIQFYILASDKVEDRWHYTQRLINQSVRSGKSVHIHTACAEDTRLLLEKLASSQLDKDNSETSELVVVDHKGFEQKIAGQQSPDQQNITQNDAPETARQVLINLSEEVPYFFSSFETTLEVIHDEPKAKAVGRERYRYYQERGYPLRHQAIQPELAIL